MTETFNKIKTLVTTLHSSITLSPPITSTLSRGPQTCSQQRAVMLSSPSSSAIWCHPKTPVFECPFVWHPWSMHSLDVHFFCKVKVDNHKKEGGSHDRTGGRGVVPLPSRHFPGSSHISFWRKDTNWTKHLKMYRLKTCASHYLLSVCICPG